MGVGAEVIVIGPLGALQEFDVQDYPISAYNGALFGNLVLGTIAVACTLYQSRRLARICGVEPWDLGNHQVRHPMNPMSDPDYIGEDTEMEIYKLPVGLLEYDNVQIWYRPNG